MKQVSSEVFFAALGNQNVHPCLRPGALHISDWKMQAGIGRCVGRSEHKSPPDWPTFETLYFLPAQADK